MLTDISTAFAGVKTALEITKGIQSLKTETAINQAVIDIQRTLLDTQMSMMNANEVYTSSLQKIDELEAEIMQMKNWSTEQQRYELADTGQGTLAYRAKAGMESGEPPHWICPNCYSNGKKSIMNIDNWPYGRAKLLVCHPCGNEIIASGVKFSAPAGKTR